MKRPPSTNREHHCTRKTSLYRPDFLQARLGGSSRLLNMSKPISKLTRPFSEILLFRPATIPCKSLSTCIKPTNPDIPFNSPDTDAASFAVISDKMEALGQSS